MGTGKWTNVTEMLWTVLFSSWAMFEMCVKTGELEGKLG